MLRGRSERHAVPASQHWSTDVEVRIVTGQRDTSTAQTPGMLRRGRGARPSARRASGSATSRRQGVRSAAPPRRGRERDLHHQRPRALPLRRQAGDTWSRPTPGDFVFVPPYLVHQEINASADEPVDMIVARSSQENVVVNVDLPDRRRRRVNHGLSNESTTSKCASRRRLRDDDVSQLKIGDHVRITGVDLHGARRRPQPHDRDPRTPAASCRSTSRAS